MEGRVDGRAGLDGRRGPHARRRRSPCTAAPRLLPLVITVLLALLALAALTWASSEDAVVATAAAVGATPTSLALAGGRGRRRGRAPRGPVTEAERSALLSSVDLFVFDCDGVIWRGDTLIEGIKETLEFLRRLGKRLVFVTNNSTRSRKQYAAKFRKLGLDWVTEENIFASSFAAAAYLKAQGFSKKAYVIGEDGILGELESAGIQYLGGPADAGRVVDLTAGENATVKVDPDVGAIVVGFDRHFNYYKLQYATKCLREVPGCQFVATNRDAVTHLTADDEWAGGGTFVAAVAVASQREPVLVGKPAQFMTEFLAAEYGVPAARMCMVGDRLDTDILFGQAGGMRTVLVLSGVTSESDLRAKTNRIFPDLYMPSLASLRPSLPAAAAE